MFRIFALAVLCAVAFLSGATNDLDARCGGSSGRVGLFGRMAERRQARIEARHASQNRGYGYSMTYRQSTVIRQPMALPVGPQAAPKASCPTCPTCPFPATPSKK